MREHIINKLNNFIGGWYLDDTSICDELIEFSNSSPRINGYSNGSHGQFVDKNVKDSLDVLLNTAPEQLYRKYVLGNLQLVVDEYIKKYSYCNVHSPWSILEPPFVQYYPPGGGFKSWHTERGSNRQPAVSRHLVYMTYLNDVTDAGETEFYYQQLKIKPEKGLTLVWGSDWTFTHRGIPSPSQEKYIVTGWYNFV
jgi:hypothetical protein